ncbi:MAG TPA: DUF2934 domain-containing protein [Steroidobacteraceae bacterium]|nr:DUF2934 domain-containing protein [Steroidobacteraceae bacterium]HRX88674.1 DUF2934 domain-containing protein [Steroidobacteraceae bacterium]
MAREQTSDRRKSVRRRTGPELIATQQVTDTGHRPPGPQSAAAPATARASRHERVCRRAYQLAEARGFAPGRELDDWLAAEAEIERANT